MAVVGHHPPTLLPKGGRPKLRPALGLEQDKLDLVLAVGQEPLEEQVPVRQHRLERFLSARPVLGVRPRPGQFRGRLRYGGRQRPALSYTVLAVARDVEPVDEIGELERVQERKAEVLQQR